MKDVEIIGMLKAYIKASLVGVGALKGAPCQCVITENADGTHKVTMKWVDDNNVTHTDSFDVLNGQVGELADISDVSLTNLADGQVVAYNSTTQKWENVENSATVNTLNSVGDVMITTVQDGQALVWSDILSKWVNKDVGITIDNALSSTSENPVQNKVLYLALEDKANKATTLSGYGITDAYTKTETDDAITAEIEKLDANDSAVAGSYVTAVSEADGKISVTREAADVTPTANSIKMLTSGGAKAAFDAKQDTLTFDNAPTQNSNNPVKSGGVYAANEALANKLADEVSARAELGAHNWLYLDASLFRGKEGDTTYTFLPTGIEIANATSGTYRVCSWWIRNLKPNTDYILSSDVTKVSGTGRMFIRDSDSSTILCDTQDITTSKNVSLSFNTGTYTTLYIAIYSATQTADIGDIKYENLLLRIASDTDDTYQPYAKTNKELTAENEALTNKLNNEIVTRSAMGAKNLLWHDITAMKTYNTAGTWSNNVYSRSGIDWTVNDDGTVTANGTATADSELTFNTSGSAQAISGLETNNYILNGCPNGGSGTTYRLFAKCTDNNYYQDDGNGTTINVGICYVRMVVYNGQTVNNITFKPMVRLATDSDATYQPYAKTNRELTSEQGYCTEDQYTAIQTLLS